MSRPFSILVLACACRPSPPAASAPPEPEEPAQLAPARPRCDASVAALVPPLPPPPPGDRACRSPDPAAFAALAHEVRAAWMRSTPQGEVAIDPGCDRLGELAEIDVEIGDPELGSFVLLRLGRHGPRWDATLIEYRHAERPSVADDGDPWQLAVAGAVDLHVGSIADDIVAPALARVRTAFALVAREVDPTAGAGGSSAGFSIEESHVRVRVRDVDGFGSERGFTGARGSGPHQADTLPIVALAPVLSELRLGARFRGALRRVDERAAGPRVLLRDRLAIAGAAEVPYFGWFLREWYVALVGVLGGAEHVALVRRIAVSQDDPAFVPVRMLAVTALATLTGFDARHDRAGRPRTLAEASAEIVARCGA